ncbi:maleylpyruvate isomerase family mycothiol-dependent enzyme [Nocardia sp. R16R-3T]
MTSEASETTVQLETVAAATNRLLDTIRGLDDDVTAPSLLPGWTRGHLLAHIARNADSLVNLLLWARTGIETPQYASMVIRDADIAGGAPRPLAEQLADNDAAANRWLALAQTTPEQAWTATVRTRHGKPIPATEVIWMRLQEVEIHHVDLAAGYRPGDWPDDFVARLLPLAAADLTKASAAAPDPAPAFGVHTTDTDFTATVGLGSPDHTITGTAAGVLAWLLGRSDGADLRGALPRLPSWK